MRKDDVDDLINQLATLQLQQADLIARLSSARDSEAAGTRTQADVVTSADEREQTRQFNVGDAVRIKNPNLFQTNRGTVTKTTATRVTVTTPKGTKILRAAKNLTHEA
jgi:hypothetical protein